MNTSNFNEAPPFQAGASVSTTNWLEQAWQWICQFCVQIYARAQPLFYYFYYLARNFLQDQGVLIWNTLTSAGFQQSILSTFSYYLAYFSFISANLWNSYQIYHVAI